MVHTAVSANQASTELVLQSKAESSGSNFHVSRKHSQNTLYDNSIHNYIYIIMNIIYIYKRYEIQ